MNKVVKRVALGRRAGVWAVAILLGTLSLIGVVTYGKDGGGWKRVPFARRASWADNFDPDNGDRTPGTIVRLPEVVVGLRVGGAPELYVDAAFDLEVASEEDRDAVRQQITRVREQTIVFLSELSPEELRGSEELAKTKARLLERFRTVLPSQRLKALYLSYLAVAHSEEAE